jgi:hypothetical protein
MENKPQIGIIAPEADITLLLSELGKKSPIIFSLSDILPVPFETKSYPFVLGGADGVIIAACINKLDDIKKVVEILKTCNLVRQSDRFRTLIAIVLWGNAAEEAALSIAHPNVLVCDSNTKHLPPTAELTKILRTEIPNIEPIDWISRYEFIANRFVLEKANQSDENTSEKLNALAETNQKLKEELAQLKEDSAVQNNEKINALEEAKQNLENQFLQMQTEVAVEKDEKLSILKAKEDLENQLIQQKEDFAVQNDEKVKSFQEANESLEKEITKLKKDSAAQNDERVKSLQKAIKILEKEITQLKENLAEKNGEFEQFITLKNSEIEDLRNNQEDKKKVKSLQKTNQSLEKNLNQLKEELETLTNEKIGSLEEANQNLEKELVQLKEAFAAKSEELEGIVFLKNSEIEELQKNGLEEKIISALQEDNQNLENQLAQLKQSLEQELTKSTEAFAAKSEEFEKLISLKDIVIEDLQKNQVKDNQNLEHQLAQLEKDFAAQHDKRIKFLENDNKILEYQLNQLKKDFATQTDEFEQLNSLKNTAIEDLRNRQGEENKRQGEENRRLAVLVGKLNDEISELKAKNPPDTIQIENKLLSKHREVQQLTHLQAEQNKKLEESDSKIKELKAEKQDISTREKLLQKDLSDLVLHLREEFLHSMHELTGKDTEIQRLREQLERQNELTEVVLKSTSGGDVAALRLEIDNEFSEDKPLYQIYSQLSLLRKECEFLLEEKERIQRNLDATKNNSFSLREELEIPKNNRVVAEELLEL